MMKLLRTTKLKTFLSVLTVVFSFLSMLHANPFRVATFEENGQQIDKIVVPGSPPRVKMKVVAVPEAHVTSGVNVLSKVPAFTWCYGCSATSAAMMMGYYDNNEYPDMYTGPANGGVCPLNNETYWGHTAYGSVTCGECPLSATHRGKDGRSSRGHVDDFWVNYGNSGNDPYISGGWNAHTPSDCTGDFMGTNQSKYDNSDGATTFYFDSSGSPLYDYTWSEPSGRDGCHGIRLFVESRGYTVSANFNQYIYGYEGRTQGFTFAAFQSEVDGGRPVLIHIEGHTMLGYGYNSSGSLIYIHDTWDNSHHSMVWGGTYSGMEHYGVTVVQLDSAVSIPSPPSSVSATDGYSTANVAVSWTASSGATSYSVWRGTSSSSSSAASLSSRVSTTAYTDTSATPGVLYYYWVKALNASGASGFSSSNTGYRKLSAPAGVSAMDGTLSTGVNVTWNSVPGASYYRVYRATTSGGTKTALGSWQTALSFSDMSAVVGTTYYYFIMAAVNASGTRPSTYSAYATGKRPLLANDAFGSAIAVSGNSGSTSGSTEGATKQAGEPKHNGEASAVNSVWWMWTAPSAGQATFDTIGSSFDTVLAVYTGTAVGSLTAVASNDDAVGLASRIAINTTPGTVYRIAVAGYGGEYGTVVLNWSFVSATQPTIKDAGITKISGTMYFQVSFKARSGKTYTVQRTDSLTRPSWSNVSTVSATSDGIKTVNIVIPTNKPTGYYRVKTTE